MKVKRGDLHDLYIEGGRSAVMVGDEVVVLSEIATTILSSVPDSGHALVETITRAVIDEFGSPDPPNDAGSIVIGQIHDLAAHKILILETSSAPIIPDAEAAERRVRDAMRAILSSDILVRCSIPEEMDNAFLDAVRRQRVAAQLSTALTRLNTGPELRARLRREGDGQRAASRPLARQLDQSLQVLEGAGVRCLVLKGLALAVQAWGDETARGFGDIDLLVAPADLERAYEALVAAGWSPIAGYPTPSQGWAWRQFLRVDHEVTLATGPICLDLHWHPHLTRSTFPAFDELWGRRAMVAVSGRVVSTLSPYDALAHSAGHSARDHWRWLRGIADVHRLMAQPEVWQTADRPLRHDQLQTVGIAGRMFGIPPGSPMVVHEAAARCDTALAMAIRRQSGPEREAEQDRFPGEDLMKLVAAAWRGQAAPRDHLRAVVRTALPARDLANQQRDKAWTGIPGVVSSRMRGWVTRL